MKGIVKKLIATVLTGAMMISVFVGSGVEVKAASEEYQINVKYEAKPSNSYEILFKEGSPTGEISIDNEPITVYEGDSIIINCEDCPDGINFGTIYIYDMATFMSSGTSADDTIGGKTNKFEVSKLLELLNQGTGNANAANMYIQIENGDLNIILLAYNIPTNISNSTPSATTESKPSAPAHEHSYSWVIESEATEGSDGVEVYKCSCGDVQARSVIPASHVYVRKFRDLIQNAPANGTVTYDSKMNHTFSDYIIKRLAERTDVTITIDFKWQNADYTMTIPAGVDYAPFFADTENFYGYFCFAQMTGSSIVAK